MREHSQEEELCGLPAAARGVSVSDARAVVRLSSGQRRGAVALSDQRAVAPALCSLRTKLKKCF